MPLHTDLAQGSIGFPAADQGERSPGQRRKCSHTTRAGKPCRAWAVRNTYPPACSAHAGRNIGAGAPLHNQNARTHGFYARTYSDQDLADLVAFGTDVTLEDEIGAMRVSLRRVLAAISADGDLTLEEFCRLSALAFQAARTIARLLRDKRAISGDADDGISSAIGAALDELSTIWGVEL